MCCEQGGKQERCRLCPMESWVPIKQICCTSGGQRSGRCGGKSPKWGLRRLKSWSWLCLGLPFTLKMSPFSHVELASITGSLLMPRPCPTRTESLFPGLGPRPWYFLMLSRQFQCAAQEREFGHRKRHHICVCTETPEPRKSLRASVSVPLLLLVPPSGMPSPPPL